MNGLLILYVAVGLLFSFIRDYRLKTIITLSRFCLADLQIWGNSTGKYLILQLFPLVFYLFFYLYTNKNRVGIIMYVRKKRLFWKQQIDYSLWCITNAFIYQIVIWGYGVSIGKEYMNWMHADSYFSALTGQVFNSISYGQVFCIHLLLLFMKNMMLGNIMILFWWIREDFLAGIILVSGIGFWDFFQSNYSIILRNLYADYTFWLNPLRQRNVVWLVVAFIGIICLEVFTVKRKEFR